MFEILFASSTFILRLATLVKSAEVWVEDSFRSVFRSDGLIRAGIHAPAPVRNDQTFISLFQIIFMEDKEE